MDSPVLTGPLVLQEYYKQIHKTLGMLLLYPGDRYYLRASSSSVATSISAGVPLLVDPRFLQVYNFMPKGAVMLADPSNHAVGISKMLALTAHEYMELAAMVSFFVLTCTICVIYGKVGLCQYL